MNGAQKRACAVGAAGPNADPKETSYNKACAVGAATGVS